MNSRVVRCFVAAVSCLLPAGLAVAQVTTATLYGITSAFFGLIRSAASPRTMQIGARLAF